MEQGPKVLGFLGKLDKRDSQLFARVPKYFKLAVLSYIDRNKDKYASQSDYLIKLVIADMEKHNALPKD